MSLKTLMQQFYKNLMSHACQELSECDLAASAIVFSPHPDDETLGCGGTILHKRKVGADVRVVFMTDGCMSHSHLMPPAELKVMREREAIAATHTLGLEESCLTFLGFPDGLLEHHQQAAVSRVIEILQNYQPEQIFIPYCREAPRDHAITNQIVLAALKQYPLNPTLYEYPIWFWRHWPWTSLMGSGREILAILKESMIAMLSLRLVRNFNHTVYIKDVLDLKRQALEQHASQMQELIPHQGWQTLQSVSKGEFLSCFFQDYEVFRKRRLRTVSFNSTSKY